MNSKARTRLLAVCVLSATSLARAQQPEEKKPEENGEKPVKPDNVELDETTEPKKAEVKPTAPTAAAAPAQPNVAAEKAGADKPAEGQAGEKPKTQPYSNFI